MVIGQGKFYYNDVPASTEDALRSAVLRIGEVYFAWDVMQVDGTLPDVGGESTLIELDSSSSSRFTNNRFRIDTEVNDLGTPTSTVGVKCILSGTLFDQVFLSEVESITDLPNGEKSFIFKEATGISDLQIGDVLKSTVGHGRVTTPITVAQDLSVYGTEVQTGNGSTIYHGSTVIDDSTTSGLNILTWQEPPANSDPILLRYGGTNINYSQTIDGYRNGNATISYPSTQNNNFYIGSPSLPEKSYMKSSGQTCRIGANNYNVPVECWVSGPRWCRLSQTGGVMELYVNGTKIWDTSGFDPTLPYIYNLSGPQNESGQITSWAIECRSTEGSQWGAFERNPNLLRKFEHGLVAWNYVGATRYLRAMLSFDPDSGIEQFSQGDRIRLSGQVTTGDRNTLANVVDGFVWNVDTQARQMEVVNIRRPDLWVAGKSIEAIDLSFGLGVVKSTNPATKEVVLENIEGSFNDPTSIPFTMQTDRAEIESTTVYGVFGDDGIINSITTTDPGFKTAPLFVNNAIYEQTLTFASTFDTGQTPDNDLPEGVTIQLIAGFTNIRGTVESPTLVVTPS